MEEIAKKYRKKLNSFLVSYLQDKSQTFPEGNIWGPDLCQRFIPFCTGGKLLRGCLVCFSYEMFAGTVEDEIFRAAAAIELIHTGLVIHDDIMDRDEKRRGLETLHTQYKNLAISREIPDAPHLGESLASCSAVAAYFMAASLLSEISATHGVKSRLMKFYSDQIILVATGQMQDVYLGTKKELPTESEIMSVLRDKTARYTLSIPLCAGAILANQTNETINLLYQIGENIGTIFQIRDDELGVFGDTKQTGKAVGADVREGKKTLLYYYLISNVPPEIKSKLESIFGNPKITQDQLEYVQERMTDFKIPELIDQKVRILEEKTLPLVEQLSISMENKKTILDILKFCATRQK